MLDLEDERELESWWSACVARPGELPPQLSLVQQKMVRAVGRGQLPVTGTAYVKVMWFPRTKDRLRYLCRPLPLQHEAHMLRRVAAAGIRCPEVLCVRGLRSLGLPRVCMLVLRDLDPAPTAPTPRQMIGMAVRLAAAGIYHPDLNPGNFLVLPDGEVSVLDLQSARQRPAPLTHGRLRMAAKLLCHLDSADSYVPELVSSGLLSQPESQSVLRIAEEIRWETKIRQIERCFRESTTFRVRRRCMGTWIERRGVDGDGLWVEGGPEFLHYWLGDRCREILRGEPPLLGGLFRRSFLLPGKHKLYIPRGGSGALQDAIPRLLEGHADYLEQKKDRPGSRVNTDGD